MGTPIGNLADLSPRAKSALAGADVIAAEDTRVAAKLLQSQGILVPVVRFDEHSAAQSSRALLSRLLGGENVVLISDAGMPVVSDPGAELVELAAAEGVTIDVIPGPSAVTAALAVSGFYGQRFHFLGYLSRTRGKQVQELAIFAGSTSPIILFESPHRVEKTLESAHEALGSRRFAVCRELTKVHQEVIRGVLGEPLSKKWVPKGEVTVVIEGKKRSK